MPQPRDIHIDLSNSSAQKRVAMTPQERAQRDSAQMGGNAVHKLALWALVPAPLTFGLLLHLVYQVAQTPEQMIGGAVLAAFITAMITLLPVTALRMERASPRDAKGANILWALLVAASVISAAVYFASERAGGYNSIVLLGLCAICMPLSGILPRWATMALGDLPDPVMASVPMTAMQPVETGSHTPEDVFGMWAAGRLMPSASDKVSSAVALSDYRETCDLNGVQPMTDAKFFAALKQLAMLSNGAVSSSKIGGTMHYHGWSLPTQLQAIENAPMERIAGPR